MPTIVVISLFVTMLLTMLSRVSLPFGQKPQGTAIKQVSLSFRERLLYHRASIYFIGTAMVLGGVGGWLSFAYQVVIVLAAFAIVGMKIRYTFTTEGVGLNDVVFRHWNEFSEVKVNRRRLELTGKPNFRPFKILLASGEAEEIDKLTAKMVKGEAKPETRSAVKPLKRGRPAKKT